MKGVGEEGGWRCHGRGAAVPEFRRRGLWSPVREWRFLIVCPWDLVLGEITDVDSVSGGGDGPGAVAATKGGWGELSGGVVTLVTLVTLVSYS